MVPIEELASVVAGKKTRQVSSSSWLRTSAVIIVAVLLSMARTAQAQIGTDICACSPATYTFQVRFDLTCPGNIQADNGILQTDCQLQNQEQPGDNEDFVPVFVSQITLFELGAEQQVIASQLYTGDFINGSTIVYTSVVGTDPNLNEQNITQGFQSTLLGRNAAEIGIENTWIILFTNECGVFPLFTVGDRIGWLELIDFTNPINRYCPGEVICEKERKAYDSNLTTFYEQVFRHHRRPVVRQYQNSHPTFHRFPPQIIRRKCLHFYPQNIQVNLHLSLRLVSPRSRLQRFLRCSQVPTRHPLHRLLAGQPNNRRTFQALHLQVQIINQPTSRYRQTSQPESRRKSPRLNLVLQYLKARARARAKAERNRTVEREEKERNQRVEREEREERETKERVQRVVKEEKERIPSRTNMMMSQQKVLATARKVTRHQKYTRRRKRTRTIAGKDSSYRLMTTIKIQSQVRHRVTKVILLLPTLFQMYSARPL